MKTLVSAIYQDGYPFDILFKEVITTLDPNDLKENQVLVVWGGEDISPTLYKKKVSSMTWADRNPSVRDKIEWALMKRAAEIGIPIIGVCRGAQMLCALAGGYLIQHIENHSGSHRIKTVDGKNLKVNSIHHQMMMPSNTNHELVAWTDIPRSDVYYDEDKLVKVPNEPELIYFNDVKGFGIQWHPEMMPVDHPTTNYLFDKLYDYSVV